MIYACHACDAISLCCFLRCLCSNSNGRSVTKIVSNYLCLRMGEIERETRWPREACFEVCQLRCWTGPLNCPLISSCLFTSPRRLFLAFCGSMLRKNYYLRFSSGAYWRQRSAPIAISRNECRKVQTTQDDNCVIRERTAKWNFTFEPLPANYFRSIVQSFNKQSRSSFLKRIIFPF